MMRKRRSGMKGRMNDDGVIGRCLKHDALHTLLHLLHEFHILHPPILKLLKRLIPPPLLDRDVLPSALKQCRNLPRIPHRPYFQPCLLIQPISHAGHSKWWRDRYPAVILPAAARDGQAVQCRAVSLVKHGHFARERCEAGCDWGFGGKAGVVVLGFGGGVDVDGNRRGDGARAGFVSV